MVIFFYNIFIQLYAAGIGIVSLFNNKAKKWKLGRKTIFDQLRLAFEHNSSQVIWMHCASLGEFEQGRPLIEKIKQQHPGYKLLLTFFSPSGYEIRKNYAQADWVFYLPLDSANNAKKFLSITAPKLVVFVKYEYWYHYLHQCNRQQIPVLLISAIFRENQVFFKWYGALHRKMLNYFKLIFVQDELSRITASHIIPTQKIILAGDTRFDRVIEIASQFQPIAAIEQFVKNKEQIIVAGSTWEEDENYLSILIKKIDNISLIIAPHEINESHINKIKKLFFNSILFSNLKDSQDYNAARSNKEVLIIDNIGMLSKLYRYGTIAYIGGGFNKSGIHNVLEAAVYGKPIIFGPNYKKFREANDLIKNKGGYSYQNQNQLISLIEKLLSDAKLLEKSGGAAGKYVTDERGATGRIYESIREILAE